MELVSPRDASFEIVTANTRLVVNPGAECESDAKVAIFTNPEQSKDSLAKWDYAIYELGEFELYSVFVINTPIATVLDDGSRSAIDLVYSITGDFVNLTLVGNLSHPPARKELDALKAAGSANIVAIDLDHVTITMPQLADFIRKLESKRLILRTPNDTDKLTMLLKELDLAEPNRFNKTNLQSTTQKDSLTAIVLNQT